ncbi:MAG: Nramp family divalent metal transporter [Candidatus Thermoplasmatota archaeon]|nr:Nramp family divalent metal transporter [Candidatus Thermoplasmatota archaeon]
MTKNKKDLITYPDPDPVLLEKPSLRKYIKYLSFFGPGAIVASLTIGQGQLIIGPQIGAWAGFALLWLISLSIGSYIIAYVSCRFTMLSGINVMDLFATKTKKGWFNWIIIVIMLIFIPIFTASIMTTLGQAIQWIVGIGHYLIWGVSFCLLAGILVLLGRYKLLEHTQAFFVGILAIGALFSVFYIKPDLLEILPNYLLIGQNVPNSYPQWVDQVEGFSKTPIPLVMLGFLGTLNFTLITLIGYLGWIKVKKWGIFKDQEDPNNFSEKLFNSFKKNGKITYLPDDEKEIKKSRILLKPLLIDLSIAFIIVSIVSSAYMIAGKYLLGPQEILPSDVDLIKTQGIIFSNMASWLEPLFKISVFFALFGTVYAGFEAATRMLFETGKTLNIKIKNIQYKRFMLYLLIYILVISVPLAYLMYLGLSVLLMLSITLLFIGVFGVIIYGIGAIYLSQKVLPKKYKLGKINLILSIIAIILLIIPFIFLII